MQRMKVDIFPQLGAPAIYVAQPYGGMDPAQMEGYLTYYYEYHFLYITGIEHVESKNIQGVALMKLVFHPGTDMSQAMAEVVGYVNRARAFMPPGAVPPFIMRFDAGSVPVGAAGLLERHADARRDAGHRAEPGAADFRDAARRVCPAAVRRQPAHDRRSRVDPERLRQYGLSPEEVVTAVNRSSTVVPSGNVRTGDLIRIASTNATLGGNIQELLDAPLRVGEWPDGLPARRRHDHRHGTDIIVGYAHVNGKRTVYIPVTKRADASTLDVIRRVGRRCRPCEASRPEDVKIDLVFDQSRYVVSALTGLVVEGLLGALLTGLMVLMFLRDWRSALIVVITIPIRPARPPSSRSG